MTRPARTAFLSAAALLIALCPAAADEKDWPTYNHDASGGRYNPAESSLGKANVANLEEKWRFPAKDSDLKIGVVYATPAVVEGCVYFGTASRPAFYKLSPDGKLKWSYSLPGRDRGDPAGIKEPLGVYGSALVTDDAVYFGDLNGFLYALDRRTGKELWKLDTRGKDWPEAHPTNASFASPILADGKVVFAGGAFEQWIAGESSYRGCSGRGFVVALEPRTGKILWKYDVGPKPEPLDPPVTIRDSWGEHVFHCGPATSTVWSTPSFDPTAKTIFFGTDTNNSPRRPTKDDPRLDTKYACAVIALNAGDGSEKWVTQLNPGDVWHRGMRAYDAKAGRFLDQSIGDTPKVYSIPGSRAPTRVVGVGCKNGGFYVLQATDGTILRHTPVYTGKPVYPPEPTPDPRTLALPGPLGGLQTGCATDGKNVYTNGLDMITIGTQESSRGGLAPPSGGRVTSISLDTKEERWRHERPKVPAPPAAQLFFRESGDPVASGIAVANGVVYFTTVVSKKLVALDASTGERLKEIDLGPVWSGPSVSRGRVYVGTGNLLFTSDGPAAALSPFPRQPNGALVSFGLPGDDEVSRLGAGKD